MAETDWELKERRIAWESLTKSLAEVQAALIQSGCVQFDNLKAAMADLGKSREIEFAAFLNIESSETRSSGCLSKEIPGFVCERCARKGKNTKITSGVADYSSRTYGEQLCLECQKHAKKESE